jgi:heme a synthase
MSSESTCDQRSTTGPRWHRAAHYLALFAAVFTLPLLFVGGSVTTYRVGLAVPDWPTTFGSNMFLYDFWNAPFGVRIEHSHRLYGAAVGLSTAALAAWLLAFEPRRLMKILGVLALVAVIVQGILGGTRVTQVSTSLAAVHGVTGQAFFALMVALCVLTGKDWQSAHTPVVDGDHLRPGALLAVVLVAAQIALGSWLRHFGSGIPLVAHSALALAVWALAWTLLIRVRRGNSPAAELRPAAWALAATTTLQVVLGVISFVYLLPFDGTPRPVAFYQAVARTAHQTNGALVLAAALVLCLRAFQYLSRPAQALEHTPGCGASSTVPPQRKPLDWEAVV